MRVLYGPRYTVKNFHALLALGLANTNAAALAGTITGGPGTYAEYVQQTQAPNNSRAPGRALSFLVDHPTGIVNTIGVTTSTGPAGDGTAFRLPPGTYIVDFEASNTGAANLAIYQGSSSTVLTENDDTIVGATTGTTWLHGRAYITVPAVGTNDWIMISPIAGFSTFAIATAGDAAGHYIARIGIRKLT